MEREAAAIFSARASLGVIAPAMPCPRETIIAPEESAHQRMSRTAEVQIHWHNIMALGIL